MFVFLLLSDVVSVTDKNLDEPWARWTAKPGSPRGREPLIYKYILYFTVFRHSLDMSSTDVLLLWSLNAFSLRPLLPFFFFFDL